MTKIGSVVSLQKYMHAATENEDAHGEKHYDIMSILRSGVKFSMIGLIFQTPLVKIRPYPLRYENSSHSIEGAWGIPPIEVLPPPPPHLPFSCCFPWMWYLCLGFWYVENIKINTILLKKINFRQNQTALHNRTAPANHTSVPRFLVHAHSLLASDIYDWINLV